MSDLSPKVRAQNLKRAISEVLGQDIKLSQAYEILAREENFPNWDTANARLSQKSVSTTIINSFKLEVENRIQSEGLVFSDLLPDIQKKTDLFQMIHHPQGRLIAFSGKATAGTTSALHELIKEANLYRSFSGRVVHVGDVEHSYPENMSVTVLKIEHARRVAYLKADLIVFNPDKHSDIVDAVHLANCGFKVLTTFLADTFLEAQETIDQIASLPLPNKEAFSSAVPPTLIHIKRVMVPNASTKEKIKHAENFPGDVIPHASSDDFFKKLGIGD